QLSQAVTAQNFLFDVNVSGTLTLADILITDAYTTQILPPPQVSGPSVNITSPSSGTTYTAAQTVTISASASDTNPITKVEFYDGTTLKSTASAAPFIHTWPVTGGDNGSHTWTAIAYDAYSNSASNPVVIT